MQATKLTSHRPGSQGTLDGYLPRHLTLAADRSPFAILGKSTQTAIVRAAKARVGVVQNKIDDILNTMVQHFDLMISQKNRDQSEFQLREAIKEFLMGANPKLEAIKVDLEDLKREYGA